MIVYLATNLINGKKYVGYTTKGLDHRIKGHIRKSKNKRDKHYFYLFQSALRKYGANNFKWDTLHYCETIDEVTKMEIHFIKELNTISPNGYNLTEGGNGGVLSQETKDKISQSLKRHFEINGWKDNVSKEVRSVAAKEAWKTKYKNGYIPRKGFKLTEESKQKIKLTKNEKNKIKWFNIKTNETKELSLTKMAEYCNLTPGTFSHIKQGRAKVTKCGWTIVVN